MVRQGTLAPACSPSAGSSAGFGEGTDSSLPALYSCWEDVGVPLSACGLGPYAGWPGCCWMGLTGVLPFAVACRPAAELSGFELGSDMEKSPLKGQSQQCGHTTVQSMVSMLHSGRSARVRQHGPCRVVSVFLVFVCIVQAKAGRRCFVLGQLSRFYVNIATYMQWAGGGGWRIWTQTVAWRCII